MKQSTIFNSFLQKHLEWRSGTVLDQAMARILYKTPWLTGKGHLYGLMFEAFCSPPKGLNFFKVLDTFLLLKQMAILSFKGSNLYLSFFSVFISD